MPNENTYESTEDFASHHYPYWKKRNYSCTRTGPCREQDGRGVTFFGGVGDAINGYRYLQLDGGVSHYILPGQEWEILFTNTVPRCYIGADSCNVHFKASCSSGDDKVSLAYYLNKPSTGAANGGFTLSGSGNGGWQTFELGNVGSEYHDTGDIVDGQPTLNGHNTLIIKNNSERTVHIEHLEIMRIYQMMTVACEEYGQQQCSESGFCCESGQSGFCCEDSDHNLCADNPDLIVYGEHSTSNEDDTVKPRHDYPCSLHINDFGHCGTRSYSWIHNPQFANGYPIPKNGGSLQWDFDWSEYSTLDYVGPDVCLFNFNPVNISPGQIQFPDPNTDLTLELWVNGNYVTDYHISAYSDGSFAPSYNLALPNTGYNDSGYNEVLLINRSNYDVVMTDPAIDIYRVYKTGDVCITPCENCLGACETANECDHDCEDYQAIGCGSAQCTICVGFCMSCVTPCQLCEEGYDWNGMYGWIWPCTELCETCYLPCNDCQECYTSCQAYCDSSYCCDPCEFCEQACEPCYDCQSCYNCEPSCYDYQICYLCQESCYACEGCEECQSCQPCEGCQACETTCQQPCEASCQVCQPCEGCQTSCQTAQCSPCYDCEACYSCEPSCYDYQICYLCQGSCYDCEACYVLQ